MSNANQSRVHVEISVRYVSKRIFVWKMQLIDVTKFEVRHLSTGSRSLCSSGLGPPQKGILSSLSHTHHRGSSFCWRFPQVPEDDFHKLFPIVIASEESTALFRILYILKIGGKCLFDKPALYYISVPACIVYYAYFRGHGHSCTATHSVRVPCEEIHLYQCVTWTVELRQWAST